MPAVAEYKVSRSEPEYLKYLDWSPTVIGVSVRASELLETYADVTTIRQLLHTNTKQLLSIPQFSKATLNSIFQCLSNVGFPVPGFSPRQTHIDPEEFGDYDDTLGLSKKWTAKLYIPPTAVSRAAVHPTIRRPRTSIPEGQQGVVRNKHKRNKSMAKVTKPKNNECLPGMEDTVSVTMTLPREIAEALVTTSLASELAKFKDDIVASISTTLTTQDEASKLRSEMQQMHKSLLEAINAITSDDDGDHVSDDAMYAEEIEAEEVEIVAEEESPVVPVKPTKATKPKPLPPVAIVEEETEEPEGEFEDEELEESDEDEDPDDMDLEEEETEDEETTEADSEDDSDTESIDDEDDEPELDEDDEPELDEDGDVDDESEEELEEEVPPSIDLVALAKKLSKLEIDQLRPEAVSAGVSNVMIKSIKTAENLRKAILNAARANQ